eukprot:5313410-Pleurochrysis_carterae.AAC.2
MAPKTRRTCRCQSGESAAVVLRPRAQQQLACGGRPGANHRSRTRQLIRSHWRPSLADQHVKPSQYPGAV